MKEIEFNDKEAEALLAMLSTFPELAKQQFRSAKVFHNQNIEGFDKDTVTEAREFVKQSEISSRYFIKKIEDSDDIREVYIE